MTRVEDAERPEAGWRYALGASLCCWYLPTIVPLFVGPLVDFESGRALYLRFMFLVPGLLLAKLATIPIGAIESIGVAGFVTLLLVGGVAVAWNRLPHRRAFTAAVTLVLASFNAYLLAPMFTL